MTTEHDTLRDLGLLESETLCNVQALESDYFAQSASPLAEELFYVANRLAARLTTADRRYLDLEREYNNLRARRVTQTRALEYLATVHPLTDAQQDMYDWLNITYPGKADT